MSFFKNKRRVLKSRKKPKRLFIANSQAKKNSKVSAIELIRYAFKKKYVYSVNYLPQKILVKNEYVKKSKIKFLRKLRDKKIRKSFKILKKFNTQYSFFKISKKISKTDVNLQNSI
jgi:DNA-binding GntR family transcriptional regulator